MIKRELVDLREGKNYMYIVELDGNVLTRRYGYEGGKLRKSTKAYDNYDSAKAVADKAVDKKLSEGYHLVDEPVVPEPAVEPGDEPGESDAPCDEPVDTEPAGTDDDAKVFPISGFMKLRNPKNTTCLICSLPSGYRFKVLSSLPYDNSVIGGRARLNYESVDAVGVPIDPVLMEVING